LRDAWKADESTLRIAAEQAWLTDALGRIADDKINRIDEPLP
jgi:hypothetical protein